MKKREPSFLVCLKSALSTAAAIRCRRRRRRRTVAAAALETQSAQSPAVQAGTPAAAEFEMSGRRFGRPSDGRTVGQTDVCLPIDDTSGNVVRRRAVLTDEPKNRQRSTRPWIREPRWWASISATSASRISMQTDRRYVVTIKHVAAFDRAVSIPVNGNALEECEALLSTS